jgi:hypothetical protein
MYEYGDAGIRIDFGITGSLSGGVYDMKPYEIREVDQQRVFVKEIRPGFYLCNNTLILLAEPVDLPESRIRWVLDGGNPYMTPYEGADKGFIIAFEGPMESGRYVVTSDIHVDQFGEPELSHDVEEAVAEYQKWRDSDGT